MTMPSGQDPRDRDLGWKSPRDPDDTAWLETELMRELLARRFTEIMVELARGELSVGELAEALKLDMSTVSKRLSTLNRWGIVQIRKQGAWRIASLSPSLRLRRRGRKLRLSMERSGLVRFIIWLRNVKTDLSPRQIGPADPGPAPPVLPGTVPVVNQRPVVKKTQASRDRSRPPAPRGS